MNWSFINVHFIQFPNNNTTNPFDIPSLPTSSRSANSNVIELTKSIMFIASLHCSFRKNCILKVLL
jgi:hypothetical protein